MTVGTGVGDEITEATAVDLARAVHTGELSAVEVVEAHLSRIVTRNPHVNALLDVQPEAALESASLIDRIAPEERRALPLAGLPVAVKDLIPAAGFRHTQGSPIFADRVATRDHIIVARMRQAGAIVIAKSNTPEFGLGSHTFNHVSGLTRNPYDLARSAGGSSGGAAAALAARMVPIADGSDTGGSLRNPASFCNVVGLRPSLGTVPNSPSGFAYGTLSVKGPMARTVRDCALLLETMVGFSASDPFSSRADPRKLQHIAMSGFGSALGESRIRAAFTTDFSGMFPVSRDVVGVVESAVEQLKSSDFDIVPAHPALPTAEDSFRTLRGLQMLATLGPVAEHHSTEMKADALWNVEAGRRVTGADAAAAMRGQSDAWTMMAEFLTGFDVLITPTVQVAPFDALTRYPHDIDGTPMRDYLEWMTLPSIITVTNHPAVSVPVGFTDDGLPVGLQIIGRFKDEARLLEIAKRIEDRIGSWSRSPSIRATTPPDLFPDIR